MGAPGHWIHSHRATQGCIHCLMLHGPLYQVTPHCFPVTTGERELFLQGCCVLISTLCSMHEAAISSFVSSYCSSVLLGSRGQDLLSGPQSPLSHDICLSHLSPSRLCLSLSLPLLPHICTQCPEEYSAFSLCLLLAKILCLYP